MNEQPLPTPERSQARAPEPDVQLPDPDDLEEGQTYIANLNPKSLEVLPSCRVEPSVAGAAPGSRYQFERQGYFSVDPDSSSTRLVFNRTVSLTDTWAKIEKAQKKK